MSSRKASPVSTRGNSNYALLTRLLRDYGTEVLRNLFDDKHPPGKLESNLSSKGIKEALKKLLDEGILNMRDCKLLDKTEPSSADFDIALLSKLLGSICAFSPPPSTKSWTHFPLDDDSSIQANIVRMRFYRNELDGHYNSASMDDGNFEKNWEKVSRAIIALGGQEKERYTIEIRLLKQRGREVLETTQKLEDLQGMLIPISYSSS